MTRANRTGDIDIDIDSGGAAHARRSAPREGIMDVARRRGRVVKTFDRLFSLAHSRRCVTIARRDRPMPAILVAHWPALMLGRMLSDGSIREYRGKRRQP